MTEDFYKHMHTEDFTRAGFTCTVHLLLSLHERNCAIVSLLTNWQNRTFINGLSPTCLKHKFYCATMNNELCLDYLEQVSSDAENVVTKAAITQAACYAARGIVFLLFFYLRFPRRLSTLGALPVERRLCREHIE